MNTLAALAVSITRSAPWPAISPLPRLRAYTPNVPCSLARTAAMSTIARSWHVAPTPAEARTPTDRDWHTEELPPTPQRDFLIPAERWIEAPQAVRELGSDLGIALVAYKRRIGRYLLWRAGPAAHADARYLAIAADDLSDRYTFRLYADGS